MKRREFLVVAAGVMGGWAWDARSDHERRVIILTPSLTQWQPKTFRGSLAELGYRDGVNLKIEVISSENQLDLLPKLALDAAAKAPDVIVAVNTPGTRAAMAATTNIPIVSAIVADPILLGFVKNIARPEGNVTGVANMATDITSKRIALLKEAIPSARRLALFAHPDEPIVAPQVEDVQRSSGMLGIEHRTFLMRTLEDLQAALQLAVKWKADAIVRLAGQGFALGPATGQLATSLRLPSMLMQKPDVEAGGLMSYFADHRELWRRIAFYVARLLKGAKPSELPFELPTRFELVLNLKTAKTLGVIVPTSLLARADEVVE